MLTMSTRTYVFHGALFDIPEDVSSVYVSGWIGELFTCYLTRDEEYAREIINNLKKKGVRLTENFETPLDAGPPV